MYEELSVKDYLELTRRLFHVDQDQDLIEVFGLAPYLNQRLARLSGGFQRRVIVAAALSADPEVLLLDEPTVGLDPLAQHEVKEFLKERMKGRTVLLCTHNLLEAQELCDQVVILEKGHVLIQASIKELVQKASSWVEIASVQGSSKLLLALLGMQRQAAAINEDRVRFLVGEAKQEVPPLLKGLLEQGLEIYEVRVIEASLQEVFLEKLGARR
jgi:ABC-2 type transport system ATP-binding protein